MTYIEFYDPLMTANVVSCLSRAPERVILIGNNKKQMNARVANYKKVFAARGYQIDFLAETAPANNMEKIVELLSRIVEQYPDCVFDITGGEDAMLVGLGIVMQKYPQKHLQVHRCNLKNGVFSDCDLDNKTTCMEAPMLTVDEQIQINGGGVCYGEVWEEKTYHWDLTESFLRDVEKMWTLCWSNPGKWNIQMGVFAAMEKVGTTSEDWLTTKADHASVIGYLKKHDGQYILFWDVLNRLLEQGMLKHVSFAEDGLLQVTYKNAQVKRSLIKAGQLLELWVYIAALQMQQEDGSRTFCDARNGVFIDWDGVCHDERTEQIYDTENEIDVLLMRHCIPLFISCKNGDVKREEPYKLCSVAERFGGYVAKKVLVATALPAAGEKYLYLRQRIKDMGIQLIEKEDLRSVAQLQKKLKEILSS